MRRLALALALALVASGAFAGRPPTAMNDPMPEGARWCLRTASGDGVVPFHGLDEGEASRAGPDAMLYPVAAPGLAGALVSLAAGIATHGALVSAAESKQARARAERADHLLVPYRPILDGVTTTQLSTSIMASRTEWAQCSDRPESGVWIVEYNPSFLLTQDESRVIALIRFKAWPQGMATDRRPRETSVRVVSAALEASEFKDRWIAPTNEVLVIKGAGLIADALEIALRWEAHQDGVSSIPFATYRFALGGHEQIERAQRVQGSCHRAILRTLRGDYLSVPMEPDDGDTACAGDASGTQAGPPPVPGS